MRSLSVRMTHCRPAGRRRDEPRIFRVAPLIQLNAQERETITNPRTDDAGVFPDPTSKHQRVQTTQHRRVGADAFFI
jgi:hypothetical protein